MTARVATGLDRIASGDPEALGAVRGRRVGLVAHPASVSAELEHARAVLGRAGAIVTALFGPEHGYGGEAQDMIDVDGAREPETGVPIHSLYGRTEAELSPRREQLEGLDAIVVDLQDIGSRYYTFVWTAALVLRAAAHAGVETIVLDRPNPLGGDVVEGAAQGGGYLSFVGLYPVAARHGLTIAEICAMVRELERLDDRAMRIVPMTGWRRSMTWEETGLPWVLPSPNMPAADTARVYPGGCLLEGTNLSEGRGTTRPFEIFGAPFVDGAALARTLSAPGIALRPLTFRPTFHKHAGRVCGGCQAHVVDARAARSQALYARILAAIRASASPTGEQLSWRGEAYEFETKRLAIDLLAGGPELRAAIDGGDVEGWIADQERGARTFEERRRGWMIY